MYIHTYVHMYIMVNVVDECLTVHYNIYRDLWWDSDHPSIHFCQIFDKSVSIKIFPCQILCYTVTWYTFDHWFIRLVLYDLVGSILTYFSNRPIISIKAMYIMTLLYILNYKNGNNGVAIQHAFFVSVAASM